MIFNRFCYFDMQSERKFHFKSEDKELEVIILEVLIWVLREYI